MTYLKWKLSDGTSGTGPEGVIGDRGGHAEAGWAVDAAGYRIGYLTQIADLTGLDTWDVTTQTEAQALTFCQQFYADAVIMADGRVSSPPPPDEES
jgi:hypothetical protein